MKKISLTLIFILFVLTLTSCGEKASEKSSKKTVIAMDTAITLTAYGKNAEKAIAESENEIHRLDSEMSRSNENGEIYPLNINKSAEISNETSFVINTALEVGNSTNGAFDITVAPIMDLWGFFGHGYRVPGDAKIKERLQYVNYKNVELKGSEITLKNNASIDLGGIAKGYAGDKAKDIFGKYGIESGLISFGSAIWAIGAKPDGSDWRIGITDPKNKDSHIAKLKLSGKCIATSGSYEQTFEENGQIYHHITDPSTGYPSKSGLAAVSVVCENAAYADALSTALFVMGLEKSVEYHKNRNDFDMILITDDNSVYITAPLESSFEMMNNAKYTVLK